MDLVIPFRRYAWSRNEKTSRLAMPVSLPVQSPTLAYLFISLVVACGCECLTGLCMVGMPIYHCMSSCESSCRHYDAHMPKFTEETESEKAKIKSWCGVADD